MGFEVRVAGVADAVGISRVWATASPHLVKTAAGLEAELRTSTSRVVLVAVDDGGIVGYGNVYLPAGDVREPRVRLSVHVAPTHRGRGVGSALATAIVDRAVAARAAQLLTVVDDSEQSKEFAIHRGFTIGRELSHARADLSELPAPATVPDELRLATFEELDPRDVWTATAAVVAGDPSGLSDAPAYEEWVVSDWNHPDLRRDLSVALLDQDQIVSFVTTAADPQRKVIWSNLTGTIPAYRGRGLAKVVKSHALSRARDAGFTDAFTGNDADNQPMLAVNRWLGYRKAASAWTAHRTIPSPHVDQAPAPTPATAEPGEDAAR